MINWLTYLLEASICHALFFLVYIGFLRNLSFFQINRVLLLSIVFLGFIIPILNIPVGDSITSNTVAPFTLNLQNLTLNEPVITQSDEAVSNTNWLLLILSMIYFFGVTIRLLKLYGGVNKVLKLIRKNKISEYKGIKTIYLNDSNPSFFAFFNYLFINTNKLDVSSDELDQIIDHERVHLTNKHTIDNLILELSIVVCWFNPILYKLKRELNQVHEFFADQEARGISGNTEDYSRLILRLSSGNADQYLTHQFSMKNIKKRIIMLNKNKNQKSDLLRYFSIVPSLIILLVLFGCDYEETVQKEQDSKDTYHLLISENFGSIGQRSSLNEVIDTIGIDISKNKLSEEEIRTIMINRLYTRIGKISWKGNTIYSDEYLTEYMGLKQGDSFIEETIDARLNYNADGTDLSSLYMDKGYLFFNIVVKKFNREENIDLVFEINEGDVFTVSKVRVTRNNKFDEHELQKTYELSRKIQIKSGDIFNRSKLIASQKEIAESGLFDPTNINPNIVPNPSEKTVEIEFQVSEL